MKGYRTLIFAVLMVIAGVVELQFKLMQPYMSPEAYAIGVIAIGTIVGILRGLTSTPIFQSYLEKMDEDDGDTA